LNPTYSKDSIPFGTNLGALTEGELRVGDEVEAVVDLSLSLLKQEN